MKKKATVDDVIRSAFPLVNNEKTWTRNCEARDADGRTVRATSPHAICWCAYGALEKAAFDLTGNGGVASRLQRDAAVKLSGFDFGRSLSDINDSIGGREAVVALFKKALAD